MSKGKLIYEGLKRYNQKQIINYFLNYLERKTGKPRLSSAPIILDVVPTLLCNLNCIFCIEYATEGKKHLTVETFHQIVKKIKPSPLLIRFCSGGEPFLNKNIMEFLAISKKHHIANSILTNGMLVSEDICKTIVTDSNVIIFSFSLDGARKHTVESIRCGLDFDKVVSKIQILSELKQRYKKSDPIMYIDCAVMKRNIEELPELIRLAKKWGVQRIHVKHLLVSGGLDRKESLYYYPKLVKEVFEESVAVAASEKVKISLPPLVAETEQVENDCRLCYYPWRFMKIDPDGSVRFCYMAWNNPIGNVLEVVDFSSLWNNIHYEIIRKTVNTDKPYFKYCSVCPNRKGANQIMSYIQNESECDFDKDFEKIYQIKIPQSVEKNKKSLRGLKVDKGQT